MFGPVTAPLVGLADLGPGVADDGGDPTVRGRRRGRRVVRLRLGLGLVLLLVGGLFGRLLGGFGGGLLTGGLCGGTGCGLLGGLLGSRRASGLGALFGEAGLTGGLGSGGAGDGGSGEPVLALLLEVDRRLAQAGQLHGEGVAAAAGSAPLRPRPGRPGPARRCEPASAACAALPARPRPGRPAGASCRRRSRRRLPAGGCGSGRRSRPRGRWRGPSGPAGRCWRGRPRAHRGCRPAGRRWPRSDAPARAAASATSCAWAARFLAAVVSAVRLSSS